MKAKKYFSQGLNFGRKTIEAIENAPLSLTTFLVSVSAIILLRFTIDIIVVPFHNSWYFLLHEYFFFLDTFLIILIVTCLVGRIPLQKGANFILAGFLIILTPPLLDEIISGGQGYLITYLFADGQDLMRRFFTFFGDSPTHGITYGVRTEIAIVILASSAYVFFKSKRFLRALGNALLLYVILFCLAALPSLTTLIPKSFGPDSSPVTQLDIVAFTMADTPLFNFTPPYFLAPFDVKVGLSLLLLLPLLVAWILFYWHRTYAIAMWKNARFPQLIYHGGLLFLGMILAFHFTDVWMPFDLFHVLGALVLLVAVECAWLTSVFVNDIYDTNIDRHTNTHRPLITEAIPLHHFKISGLLFFLTSLSFSVFIQPLLGFLMVVYQALAWLYSAPPFRLKRFPLIATLLAALASLVILFVGYITVSPEHNLAGLPWPIILYLLVAMSILLPLKDFKDIPGDLSDKVFTLPVLLGVHRARLFFSSALFLFYLSTPLVLHERSLFLPGIIIGGISFWVMMTIRENGGLYSFRFLSGWMLGLLLVFSSIALLLLR